MQHIFDVEIATKYGIDVATFIKNISFWIVKNQSNNEHFHDGRYWTYNKLDAFTLIFPYWSKDQIRRIITKCLKSDLIVKGNFNKSRYDQTLWYSLSDFGHKLLNITIIPNGRLDVAKSPNLNGGTTTPIPYINTDNKTHIKIKDKAQPKKQVAVVQENIDLPSWMSKELWEEFKQHRKYLKKPMSILAEKKMLHKLSSMKKKGQDVDAILNNSIANGWQGVFEIKQSKERLHGTSNVVVGKNGLECEQRDWNSMQWDILKEACGLPRDTDINKIEGLIPGEVWEHDSYPRRNDDSSTYLANQLEEHLQRDS